MLERFAKDEVGVNGIDPKTTIQRFQYQKAQNFGKLKWWVLIVLAIQEYDDFFSVV